MIAEEEAEQEMAWMLSWAVLPAVFVMAVFASLQQVTLSGRRAACSRQLVRS